MAITGIDVNPERANEVLRSRGVRFPRREVHAARVKSLSVVVPFFRPPLTFAATALSLSYFLLSSFLMKNFTRAPLIEDVGVFRRTDQR